MRSFIRVVLERDARSLGFLDEVRAGNAHEAATTGGAGRIP
jgi:hypothetical protein